jgi:hypothetical protein
MKFRFNNLKWAEISYILRPSVQAMGFQRVWVICSSHFVTRSLDRAIPVVIGSKTAHVMLGSSKARDLKQDGFSISFKNTPIISPFCISSQTSLSKSRFQSPSYFTSFLWNTSPCIRPRFFNSCPYFPQSLLFKHQVLGLWIVVFLPFNDQIPSWVSVLLQVMSIQL